MPMLDPPRRAAADVLDVFCELAGALTLRVADSVGGRPALSAHSVLTPSGRVPVVVQAVDVVTALVLGGAGLAAQGLALWAGSSDTAVGVEPVVPTGRDALERGELRLVPDLPTEVRTRRNARRSFSGKADPDSLRRVRAR